MIFIHDIITTCSTLIIVLYGLHKLIIRYTAGTTRVGNNKSSVTLSSKLVQGLLQTDKVTSVPTLY